MKERIGYKLSPNEEARLLKEARESLRKQRLLQVRQQAKLNAAKIRQSVKEEKQRQLQILAKEIEDEWRKEKEEKLQTLKEIYDHSMKHVGEAHRNALIEETKEDNRDLVAKVNSRRAKIRHETALQELHQKVAKEQEEANRHIIARQTALELEKARAAEIAQKPPPPPDPVAQINAPKVRPVKFTDLDAFSATHYHIPEVCYVEKAKAEHQEVTARELAEVESEKLADLEKEQKRAFHEQKEKARLRHKHALKKELLKQDYANMLHDLSDLQRADMHRRQLVVAKIPKQIFIPPHRRLEEKEDAQREMEGAFEDMYLKATEYFGDLSLALDPHPPPETPSVTESLDLSVQDIDATVTEEQESIAEDGAHVRAPAQTQLTNGGYQQLLNRIKQQREMAQKTSSSVTPEHLTGGSTSAVHPSQPGQEQTDTEEAKQTPEGLRRLVKRIKSQRFLGQKTSGITDKALRDIRDEPSPASQATTLSQHPITDTTPSSTTEVDSLSSGMLSSNGSSSLTQRTLTTQSSMSTVSMTTEETGQSEMSTETLSESPSEQDVFASANSSVSTVIDVGKATEVERNHLLLHPLEEAAQIRQNVSQYLQAERRQRKLAEQSREMDLIGPKTIQSQSELEEQKRQLEEKLAEIERQRLLVVSRMSDLSRRRQDSTIASQSLSSFCPLGGSTSQLLSTNQPPPSSAALIGSLSAAPLNGYQSYQPILGEYPTYGMPDLPPRTTPKDLLGSRLEHVQEYRQDTSAEHGYAFSKLMASRQQLADRAQQLLQMNSNVAKDVSPKETRPFEFNGSSGANLIQVPMSGSSQNSSDRQSLESGLLSDSPVRISGISEMHSTFPCVSDLEDRFTVLEHRLHKAGVALAPTAGSSAEKPAAADEVSAGQMQEAPDEEDSFDKRRNELEAELDAIEKQKADILQQDQLQKEKIQHLKNEWFTMAPHSDELQKQMSPDRFPQPTVPQGIGSFAVSPRRRLSFPNSTLADLTSTSDDFQPLGKQLGDTGSESNAVDVAKKKPLLYHPHEFNNRNTTEEQGRSSSRGEFSWPVMQRSSAAGEPAATGQNTSKSGRTWHTELLECSMSSGSSSQKSFPKKLPTPPSTEKESLVFEVEDAHLPVMLHYEAKHADSASNQQMFATVPARQSAIGDKKESQSPRSCLSSNAPNLVLQQKCDEGVLGMQSVGQSQPAVKTSRFETVKQGNSDIHQYTMSDESHRASQQFTSDLSQLAMSGHSGLTTRGSDHPRSSSEFEPLPLSSRSSRLDQTASDGTSRRGQNARPFQSSQDQSSEMAEDISRRIEQSLAHHRQLIEQTTRIMDQHNKESDHQVGTDWHTLQSDVEEQQSLSTLKEQTGILDEPDITLVSLDSTMEQEPGRTEDSNNRNISVSMATTGGSMPADTISLASTSLGMTTTPTSTTQSPVYVSVMFRDPSTSPQHQKSVRSTSDDFVSETLREPDTREPSTSTSEQHLCGVGARPKHVQFEITDDTSDSGRCKHSEQQNEDVTNSSQHESDFASIHIQHMDGSSTDEYEGLTLREAFMKKKRDFIEASERRKKKAEEKAKRIAAKSQQQPQQRGSLGKTLASWKKSRKLNSQPVVKRQDPTTIVERTSEQRKKDEREMKARTSRLYRQLEEVKQRKLEEERKKQYAMNRERAKAFYQKLEKQRKS